MSLVYIAVKVDSPPGEGPMRDMEQQLRNHGFDHMRVNWGLGAIEGKIDSRQMEALNNLPGVTGIDVMHTYPEAPSE